MATLRSEFVPMQGVADTKTCEAERARLAELLVTEGSGREPALQRIVALAAHLLRIPAASVTIVGSDQVWFETSVGLDIRTAAREGSFGGHVVESEKILVVPDATRDVRFSVLPAVRERRIVFYAGAPMRTSDGFCVGAFCVFGREARSPLTELERQLLQDFADVAISEIESRRARRLNGILQGIANTVGAALICTDESGTILFQNPAAERLLGFDKNELIGKDVACIVPERFVAGHRTGMARVAAGAPSKLAGKVFESFVTRKDGSELSVDLGLFVWHDEFGLKIGSSMRDSTDRKQREERLSKLAYYDPLTGLARASRFDRTITEHLDIGGSATVLIAEIDGLQGVNDALGHAVGDALIQAIAIRLLGAVAHGARLARLSGGTFGVLLRDHDPIKARECASDIEMALAEPFEIGDHRLVIAASIGAALAPDHAATAEDLVAAADLALQRAKPDTGNRFRLYERTMQTERAARRALRDEVRQALDAGDLVLYYQPQVSLATGAIVGVEALMRWRHPRRGLLLPGAFIPAMDDDSALALSAGWWSLDQACKQIAAWRAERRPLVRVSVNLFAAQLRYSGLKTVVQDFIKAYAITPGELELEVRETIANQDEDAVVEVLRDLRALGVGIALDDFGTGYASLSTLKRLPVSTIKIDRSFVQGLAGEDGPRDRAIVEAVLGVGHGLGLDVVAEGIETPAQAAVLTRLGCPTGQGFLYGRAMVADEVFAPNVPQAPPARTPARKILRRNG